MSLSVVGRPLMGMANSCVAVIVNYRIFSFQYSMSKMNDFYFTNEIGILPDIYIPWIPEHLKEDLDLKRV